MYIRFIRNVYDNSRLRNRLGRFEGRSQRLWNRASKEDEEDQSRSGGRVCWRVRVNDVRRSGQAEDQGGTRPKIAGKEARTKKSAHDNSFGPNPNYFPIESPGLFGNYRWRSAPKETKHPQLDSAILVRSRAIQLTGSRFPINYG